MRMIDADAFLQSEIKRCHCVPLVGSCDRDYESLKVLLMETPGVDAVSVVQCKDCEFSRELTKTEKKIWLDECRACESPEASQGGYMIVFPEHFCSYGRRKEQCD